MSVCEKCGLEDVACTVEGCPQKPAALQEIMRLASAARSPFFKPPPSYGSPEADSAQAREDEEAILHEQAEEEHEREARIDRVVAIAAGLANRYAGDPAYLAQHAYAILAAIMCEDDRAMKEEDR